MLRLRSMPQPNSKPRPLGSDSDRTGPCPHRSATLPDSVMLILSTASGFPLSTLKMVSLPSRQKWMSKRRLPSRRSVSVTSGSQSGSAGSTYSLPRGASCCNPSIACSSMNGVPAAHACGTFAPRYWTGKIGGIALQPAIQFWQLVQQEMARRAADVTRHRRRLGGKSVAPHPQRDQRVVVRPDCPCLIVVRIERGMIRRESADAPPAPHVLPHQPFHHFSGTLRCNDAGPQALPDIGYDRQHLVLLAIQRVGIEAGFLVPECFVELSK